MKYLLLPLFGLFMAIHAYGAAIDIADPIMPMHNPDCDTILLTSGAQFEGEIIEEKEDEFKVRLCDHDRLVLVEKSDIEEIRTVSGSIRKVGEELEAPLAMQKQRQEQLKQKRQKLKKDEPFDPEKKRKLIIWGIILILIALAITIPSIYVYLFFWYNELAAIGAIFLLLPFLPLAMGLTKLLDGLFMRKKKKKRRKRKG